jgi:hypothetical protein
MLCVLAAFTVRSAVAGDVNWTNPVGGNFTDGTNWSGGSAPGMADNAVFGLGSASGYPVTIQDGQQIANSQLRVGSDNVTLNFADNGTDAATYALTDPTDSLLVGENSGDKAQLTLLAQNLSSGQLGLFASGAVIGDQAGSTGSLIVGTASSTATQQLGTLLTLSGPLTVGNAGAGQLTVYSSNITYDGNGNPITTPGVVSGPAIVGNQKGASGTVSIGSGNANVYGAWAVNGNASIAATSGSAGSVTVDEGQWAVTGDINVGGSETSAGGTAALDVNANGEINYVNPSQIYLSTPYQGVSSVLRVYAGGTVNLNGGSITVGALDDEGGTFNFNSGSVAVGGNLDIGAPGDLINTSLTLNNRNLLVGGNTNVNGQTLQISGGAFSTGTLTTSNGGTVQFNSGSFTLTNGDLTIGPGGLLGPNVNVAGGNGINDLIAVSGQTTIAQGGTLSINGGQFATGTLASSGTINFQSGALSILNGGLTVGPGQPLGANVNLGSTQPGVEQGLYVSGQATINPGSSLTVSGGTFSAASVVNHGSFTFSSGQLYLNNLTIGGDGPLGSSLSINYPMFLSVSGQTIIEAGSSLTITDGYFQTGQLSGTGSLQFPAGSSGTLAITDGGLAIGAGTPLGPNLDLNGQTLTVSGQTTIDAGSSLTIAGGSLTANSLSLSGTLNLLLDSLSPYSSPIDVQEDAALDGFLGLFFGDSFQSATGDTYDILLSSQGMISGTFSNAPQGTILDVDGRMLQVDYTDSDVTLTDIGAAVPEPSAIGLLLAVGGTLLTRRPGRRCL